MMEMSPSHEDDSSLNLGTAFSENETQMNCFLLKWVGSTVELRMSSLIKWEHNKVSN